ncbi:hypothetical protein B0H12DRAFT_1217272, partial [Mycena haematopus]
MRTPTLILLAIFSICIPLASNAAPLNKRGSVGDRTSENHIRTAVKATPPPWRSSPSVEMRLVQPTPPPWRRSVASYQEVVRSSRQADAPGWKAHPASLILERAAQPTPPPWRHDP